MMKVRAVSIDDELWAAVRAVAAERACSAAALVRDALRRELLLSGQRVPPAPEPSLVDLGRHYHRRDTWVDEEWRPRSRMWVTRWACSCGQEFITEDSHSLRPR